MRHIIYSRGDYHAVFHSHRTEIYFRRFELSELNLGFHSLYDFSRKQSLIHQGKIFAHKKWKEINQIAFDRCRKNIEEHAFQYSE